MSKIVRVEVGRFDYALVGDFKFFKGGKRPSVLVRLTDEDGVQGWGQSVPVETWTYETVESVESTLTHYLAAAILGADPTDLADIHARMERAIRPSFSMGQPLAKAAIDLGNRGQTTFSAFSFRKRGLSPISDEGIVSPVETAEFIALGMLDGIAMKIARCGGLWNASRIVTLLDENGLLLFASGLTDPDWSLAASVHLFAWAGLARPAALNGPQYIEGRGTIDAQFRAVDDIVRLPATAGLGVIADARADASLGVVAQSESRPRA